VLSFSLTRRFQGLQIHFLSPEFLILNTTKRTKRNSNSKLVSCRVALPISWFSETFMRDMRWLCEASRSYSWVHFESQTADEHGFLNRRNAWCARGRTLPFHYFLPKIGFFLGGGCWFEEGQIKIEIFAKRLFWWCKDRTIDRKYVYVTLRCGRITIVTRRAISIAYSENVFVALRMQHSVRMRHISTCGLLGLTIFLHVFS